MSASVVGGAGAEQLCHPGACPSRRWQAGAALSHSWGTGSYEADNGMEGDITTNMTGLYPYGRYALTPRLGIWASAGYGWGNL